MRESYPKGLLWCFLLQLSLFGMVSGLDISTQSNSTTSTDNSALVASPTPANYSTSLVTTVTTTSQSSTSSSQSLSPSSTSDSQSSSSASQSSSSASQSSSSASQSSSSASQSSSSASPSSTSASLSSSSASQSSSSASESSTTVSNTNTSLTITLQTLVMTSGTMMSTVSVNATSASSSVTANGTSVGSLSCPTFVCTTDCYTMFTNVTASSCALNTTSCEVSKQEASYSVGCSVACAASCGNGTLGNCSVACCNTSSCINATLFALWYSATTSAPTKPPSATTTTTTTKATTLTSPAYNGKKCQDVKCDGTTCFKTNAGNIAQCLVGQDYCMLRKTTSGATDSWLGGCSDDCRKMTSCSAAVTTSCFLECCNATASSCLKLTGEANLPGSAPGGRLSAGAWLSALLLVWGVGLLV